MALIPLAALGAVAACLSLGVVVDLRGWMRGLANHGSRLGGTRRGVVGLLFRGRYPTLLIRIIALQALAVALLLPAALSYAIGAPTSLFFAPMLAYMLAFLAAMVWATADRLGNRIQGPAAPIFGVVMFSLFVVLSGTLTAFGSLSSFLFGHVGR
ncbi:MAG TPA: hypothetical protein VGO86_17575 [Candidatus Dormibacteraeota bacterium]